MIDAATILVADDCADDLELLKRAIQKAGLKNPVQFVFDGEQAMEYLKPGPNSVVCGSGCPLLLFLDLNMPRCTGFAVLDWLRQQPHLRNLPTIVFSNSDHESDIDQSFRLGAHGYWVKPSRFEDLVKMMVRLKEILSNVARKLDTDTAIAMPVPA
jgi:CheY-like chemotaxis protein